MDFTISMCPRFFEYVVRQQMFKVMILKIERKEN